MLSGLLPKNVGKRIAPAKAVRKNSRGMLLVFFAMIIYSIFLPMESGTMWFYAGLAVYLVGFSISTAVLLSIAATEPGEPFTTGMYRCSRHPIALGTPLPFIGVGIACASWVFLLLSAILAVASHRVATAEELATADEFGDAYREYMERTPRWIGVPKAPEQGEHKK